MKNMYSAAVTVAMEKRKTAGDPKRECLIAMTKIMDAFAKQAGSTDWAGFFNEIKNVKVLQNKLVYALADLANDIRMEVKFGDGDVRKQFPRWHIPAPPLSVNAALWYWDQNTAIHFTLSRKVLEALAKSKNIQVNTRGWIR